MDASWFRAVNRFADRTGWAHPLFREYATKGIVLFALLMLAGWWLARRDNDTVAMAKVLLTAPAVLLALGGAQILGHAVGRMRPFATLHNVHTLVPHAADFSFPSDHATATGAIAIGLLLARRSLGGVTIVLAMGMAFARVYVGVHYPGDVAAGLLLGGAAALLVVGLGAGIVSSWLDRLRTTTLRVLITARGD